MRKWYYTKDGERVGPVEESDLIEILKTLPLLTFQIKTFVWSEGMSDWTEARNVRAFQRELTPTAPPSRLPQSAQPVTPQNMRLKEVTDTTTNFGNEIIQKAKCLSGSLFTKAPVAPQPPSECPSCNKENAGGTEFCVHCGGVLLKPCPECGKHQAAENPFCGNCGTKSSDFEYLKKATRRLSELITESKWDQVIQEKQELDQKIQLNGSKGRRLHATIEKQAEKAKRSVAEIQRLEKAITDFLEEDEVEENKEGVHLYEAEIDQKIYRYIKTLGKLKPLSERVELLEKEIHLRRPYI